MGSTVATSATYDVVCDLCAHAETAQAAPVPDGWANVYGPNTQGPPVPRKKLLCATCNTGYKTFWRIGT